MSWGQRPSANEFSLKIFNFCVGKNTRERLTPAASGHEIRARSPESYSCVLRRSLESRCLLGKTAIAGCANYFFFFPT